ncbi:YlxM family DNA-binding protein [Globicatella sanguinis]|uniref:YlxM family DNA-binding protein n=2 Tax=Globicatella sanguinis TaxID=13076 RepID=UPI000AEE62BA
MIELSLEAMVRMNMLFSYYQTLLTKKQQQMLALYYEEDYSLGEIAEHYKISRQAVHDTIKRSEKALEQYEANLGLLKKRNQREVLLDELLLNLDNKEQATNIIHQLKEYDE